MLLSDKVTLVAGAGIVGSPAAHGGDDRPARQISSQVEGAGARQREQQGGDHLREQQRVLGPFDELDGMVGRTESLVDARCVDEVQRMEREQACKRWFARGIGNLERSLDHRKELRVDRADASHTAVMCQRCVDERCFRSAATFTSGRREQGGASFRVAGAQLRAR